MFVYIYFEIYIFLKVITTYFQIQKGIFALSSRSKGGAGEGDKITSSHCISSFNITFSLLFLKWKKIFIFREINFTDWWLFYVFYFSFTRKDCPLGYQFKCCYFVLCFCLWWCRMARILDFFSKSCKIPNACSRMMWL